MKSFLNFVVAFVMILQTGFLSAIPAHAEGEVTETPTPEITNTPEPTATETASPTLEPTSTPVPSEPPSPTPASTSTPLPSATPTTIATEIAPVVGTEEIALSLSSDPAYLKRGGELYVQWEIKGLGEIAKGTILRFYIPKGLTRIDSQVMVLGEAGDVLDIEVTEFIGKVGFIVGEEVESPLIILAELLQEEKSLASSELSLFEPSETIIDIAGGRAGGLSGKVQVTFPEGSLSEKVLVSIGRPTEKSLPVESLSGSPFEITALSEAAKAEVSQFPQEVEIQVKYDETELSGDEDDLRMFWFDPSDNQWKLPLRQHVDTENNILYAYTDHFTVFDTYNSGWQSAETPTLELFQHAGYTGAASFSMPIKVPPGPGGFQPSLSLSYNSQVVDSSTTETQASWVGMGWSLDAGAYVERNGFGTKDESDDSYNLTLQGMGGALWQGTTGRYHLENENFAKIIYNETTDVWTVQDKVGNWYYFEESAGYERIVECPGQSQVVEALTWRWMLKRAVNIYGQEITYNYVREYDTATTVDLQGCTIIHYLTHYIYPDTIEYGNGRYRVKFNRVARYDYKPEWLTLYATGVYKTFQRSRLSSIYVQQDADGDGTFETLIRKYVFTFCAEQSCSIFPAYVWPSLQNYRTPTLTAVKEYGLGGTSYLPAYTFKYEDGMHMTYASNGRGGEVTYAYDTWNETIPVDGWSDGIYESAIPRWGNPLKCHFQDSKCDWEGVEDQGTVGGGSNGFIRVLGLAEKLVQSYQPGRWYRIVAGVKRPSGFTDGKILFGYSFKVNNVQQPPVYQSALVTSTGLQTLEGGLFFLPRDTTSFKVLIDSRNANESAGYNDLYWYYLMPMPTYARVRSRTLSAGGNTYTFTYGYPPAPVMNTTANSVAADTDHPYTPLYSEFRGYEYVTETDPYGKQVTTTYGQTDCDSGRALSVTTTGGGITMQSSRTSYACTETVPATIPVDTEWPFATDAFTGIAYRWVHSTSQIDNVHDATGAEAAHLTTVFGYNANNGNLIYQTVSGTNISTRTTRYEYYSYTADGKWLIGLPDRIYVYQGSTILAELFNLYEDTLRPGILTGTRTLMDLALNRYSQTSFTHDEWGNVTSQKVWTGYGTATQAPTTGLQTTTIAYDAVYHTYPTSITNTLGQTTTLTYDYALSVPISETGPNGAATKVEAEYDVFGRLTKLIRPGDSSSSPTLGIAYSSGNPLIVTMTQKIQGAQNFVLARQYDGLGRPTLVTTNNSIFVSYSYGYVGGAREDKQSMPYTSTATDWTKVEYDAFARPVSVTAPDNTITSYDYDGLQTKVTDANGNSTYTTTDILGRTLLVDAPTGPDISFAYDPLGNLLKAERGDGNILTVVPGDSVVSMTYDNAGRKLEMDDPDMGFWQYSYDALGNLKIQTDARGCTLTLTYDDLNRLDTKTSSGICGQQVNVDYDYDAHSATNYGIGFRTSMNDGTSTNPTSWEYDERGRLAKEIKRIDSQSYTTIFTYNSADLLETMTYPGGEEVTYAYDSRMMTDTVIGMDTYVSGTQYDTAGRMTTRTLGNGLTQKYIYKPWNTQGGRLDAIVAGSGTWDLNSLLFTNTIQKLTYEYDSVGNVTDVEQVIDFGNNVIQTQSFTYDALNRLKEASATGGTLGLYDEVYTYDSTTGNLLTKGTRTDLGGQQYVGENKYNYDANHDHAVASLVQSLDENVGVNSYSYDSNGNMEHRDIGGNEYELDYDAENRLVSVSGTNLVAQFTYNGEGQRVKSVINNETIYFVNGYLEQKGSEITKYYLAGASRIAMRKYIVPENMVVTYLLGDHLGSTSITVDATSGEVVETRYKPWGEVRFTTETKTLPTRYTFTGQYSHMSDDATDLGAAGFGLLFYNARWYDPMLGRFAQADSILPGGVQGLDRYAYVNNSPVRYTDPSGHSVDCAIGEQYCEAGTYNSLTLIGSPEDKQSVVDILNSALEGTGYTVSVDEHGSVTINYTGDATSPLTPEQQAVLKYLKKYINSNRRTTIKVVSGTEIPFADFDTGTIDIQDIADLGKAPGMSAASVLFHELEEQYAKQVLEIMDYDDAHDLYAVPAEEAVAGAFRIDFLNPSPLHLNPKAIIGYDYGNEGVVCTQITYSPFTILEYECSFSSFYPGDE